MKIQDIYDVAGDANDQNIITLDSHESPLP